MLSKKFKKSIILILLFIAVFIISLNNYFYKYFPDVTVSELTFFITTAFDGGVKGTSSDLLKVFIKKCIVKPIFITFIVFYLIDIFYFLFSIIEKVFLSLNTRICLSSKKIKNITYVFKRAKNKIQKYYFCILILLSLASIFCCIGYVIITLSKSKSYSNFYEKEFLFSKKENIIFPKNKKNLIVIHIESLEKTFENKDFFGSSLIPDMEKFEKEGVQFSNYQNGFATSFTEGSLIALFTGTPCNILSVAGLNVLGNDVTIFNNIYSLGRILKDNGYKTYSIQSSDSSFAGAKKFFVIHGIDEIIDANTLKLGILKGVEYDDWGFRDKELFTAVKDKIENIDKNIPYFMYIQTVDTHFKALPNVDVKKFENPYYNVIYNTNLVISDFIDWFKNKPEYKNTVIVLVGDHLRMGRDFKMPNDRQIYNLFLNSVVKPKNLQRTFSQIDLFPSVLEAIGVKIVGHKLGLGTSIFSNQKTLSERFSAKKLNNTLSKRNKLYESLW